MAILVRMGVKTFNREAILGRDIDELNLRRTGRLFRHFFVAPPGPRARQMEVAAAGARGFSSWASAARRPVRWLIRVYRYDLPFLVRRNWLPLAVVVVFLAVAIGIGWAYVARYPLPQGVFSLDNLGQETFQSLPEVSFLPSLTTRGIFFHNLWVLLLAGAAAVISLGVLSVLMLMVPIGLVSFFTGQMAWLGYDPLVFLGAFVLPHGLFEIPAAILATAFAVRIGASVTAPREGLTVGEGLVAAIADFAKVFLFLVIPLLFVAAFVEANLTPQIVVWVYGG
jgi:uncharacterized membrane protein SpoIIM required for sporulation